jgi:hypothetical protein
LWEAVVCGYARAMLGLSHWPHNTPCVGPGRRHLDAAGNNESQHATCNHRMVHDTDIIELELKSKKFTLNLRKKEALQAAEPVVQARTYVGTGCAFGGGGGEQCD